MARRVKGHDAPGRQEAGGVRVEAFTGGGVVAVSKRAAVRAGQAARGSQQAGAPSGSVDAVRRIAVGELLRFYDWNVWHRRCCALKAGVVAGLGWWIERDERTVYDSRTGEGDAADRAAALLLRPNPEARLEDVLTRCLVDYEAAGELYVEVVTNGAGEPCELYHLPVRTMAVRPASGGRRVGAFVQRRGTQAATFTPLGETNDGAAERSECLRLVQYDPGGEGWYGLPGWYPALLAMGLDRAVGEYNVSLFRNSLMATAAITVTGGKVSEAGRAAIRQFVRDQATGPQNAGRILLLEDESERVTMKVERLNVEPTKGLLLHEVHGTLRDQVIGAHGVPPRLLGIATPGQLGATGEVEGQLRSFRETVVRPVQRLLEEALGRVLDRVVPGTRIRFADLDVTGLGVDVALLKVLYDAGDARAGAYAGRLVDEAEG